MPVVLITGISGFAGSHIAEYVLANTDWSIVGMDRYSYAGRMGNLAHLDQSRIKLVYHDFTQPIPPMSGIDYIIHNGAETHVKNSLQNPAPFVSANIMGTFNMLEFARASKPTKFLYVSTDEVFGAAIIPHKEDDALTPSNPYSATKAAGEYLVRAYGRTFGVPYIITRTMNLFGSRQHVEKFIPMTIEKLKAGLSVEIHTNKKGEVGSRQWIHASDQASALLFLLQNGNINDTYHIAGEKKDNLEIAVAIAKALNVTPDLQMVNAFYLYPGHDLHYAIDDSKIRGLGWAPKLTFDEGLKITI